MKREEERGVLSRHKGRGAKMMRGAAGKTRAAWKGLKKNTNRKSVV